MSLEKGIVGLIIGAILFKLALLAAVIWVIWHFISKYW